jgi:hypothetical protein
MYWPVVYRSNWKPFTYSDEWPGNCPPGHAALAGFGALSLRDAARRSRLHREGRDCSSVAECGQAHGGGMTHPSGWINLGNSCQVLAEQQSEQIGEAQRLVDGRLHAGEPVVAAPRAADAISLTGRTALRPFRPLAQRVSNSPKASQRVSHLRGRTARPRPNVPPIALLANHGVRRTHGIRRFDQSWQLPRNGLGPSPARAQCPS